MIYPSAGSRKKKTAGTSSISRERLTILKLKAQRVEDMEINRSSLWDYALDLFTWLQSSFIVRHRQCHHYGHSLPPEGWVSGLKPRCADCGHQISSPDELRRAEPRI